MGHKSDEKAATWREGNIANYYHCHIFSEIVTTIQIYDKFVDTIRCVTTDANTHWV